MSGSRRDPRYPADDDEAASSWAPSQQYADPPRSSRTQQSRPRRGTDVTGDRPSVQRPVPQRSQYAGQDTGGRGTIETSNWDQPTVSSRYPNYASASGYDSYGPSYNQADPGYTIQEPPRQPPAPSSSSSRRRDQRSSQRNANNPAVDFHIMATNDQWVPSRGIRDTGNEATNLIGSRKVISLGYRERDVNFENIRHFSGPGGSYWSFGSIELRYLTPDDGRDVSSVFQIFDGDNVADYDVIFARDPGFTVPSGPGPLVNMTQWDSKRPSQATREAQKNRFRQQEIDAMEDERRARERYERERQERERRERERRERERRQQFDNRSRPRTHHRAYTDYPPQRDPRYDPEPNYYPRDDYYDPQGSYPGYDPNQQSYGYPTTPDSSLRSDTAAGPGDRSTTYSSIQEPSTRQTSFTSEYSDPGRTDNLPVDDYTIDHPASAPPTTYPVSTNVSTYAVVGYPTSSASYNQQPNYTYDNRRGYDPNVSGATQDPRGSDPRYQSSYSRRDYEPRYR